MIPFFGLGRDQLAKRVVGKPRAGYKVMFMGGDGTGRKKKHVWIHESIMQGTFNLKGILLIPHVGYNSTLQVTVVTEFQMTSVKDGIYNARISNMVPPSAVMAVTISDGLPSPADVLAVT